MIFVQSVENQSALKKCSGFASQVPKATLAGLESKGDYDERHYDR